MADLVGPVELIEAAVSALDERDPLPPLEVVALWLDVSDAADRLRSVIVSLRYDATDALVGLLDGTGRDVLETPSGYAKLGREYAPTHWRGWALCDEIADDLISTDGEIVRAVPVERLREVLPGCESDDLVSSRWRTTVGQYVPKLDAFREQTPWRERRPQIESLRP